MECKVKGKYERSEWIKLQRPDNNLLCLQI